MIICGIVLLFWSAITAKCILAQKRVRWLSPVSNSAIVPETLSVIIPARNEEEDIAASLYSVLNQEGVDLEVIVVNDHSFDHTREVADHIARSDPRLRVLHDPPLPKGWLGKCNAMQKGAEAANGAYLLFADADILHSPACLATAYNLMKEESYDFISLLPFLENRSFWENVNIPIYFFGLAKLLATPGLEDPESPNALASGALMLLSARTFRDVGGFEDIKGEMLDDVGFARLLKKHRYRVGFRIAPECLRVRLFKNSRDAFWGTTKNILTAVEGRTWLAIPLMILGVLVHWTPLLAVVLGTLDSNELLLLAGVATYGIQYFSFFSVRRLMGFYPLKLLFFPLAALVASCCIVRALSYHIKGTLFWRGREIKVRG